MPAKELVLVKCTEQSKARLTDTDTFGYPGDLEATYGRAKWKESLQFFFKSNDSETLEKIVVRLRVQFDELKRTRVNGPARLVQSELMEDFEDTLLFFEGKGARTRVKQPLSKICSSR